MIIMSVSKSQDEVISISFYPFQCIIYGKCSDTEKLQSAYNKQLPGNPIKPFAEMLPMIEGIAAERQYDQLDQLFNKVVAQ